MKKKFLNKVLTGALVCTLAATMVAAPLSVSAKTTRSKVTKTTTKKTTAKKKAPKIKAASLNRKSVTIPVGRITKKACWNMYTTSYDSFCADEVADIKVKNKVKGASYTFTSSNPKIATISPKGGYATGVKAGKTTIVCTQNLKGKKTVVGKTKITVKAAGLGLLSLMEASDTLDTNMANEKMMFGWITYYNPDAKYAVSVDSKDANVDISYAGFPEKTNAKAYISFASRVPGTYKVTVTETYKGKTRTLGVPKVRVNAPSIDQTEMTAYVGQGINYAEIVRFAPETDARADAVDTSVADFEETEDGDTVLRAKKEGTTDVVYSYDNVEGETITFGVLKLTVKANHVTGLSASQETSSNGKILLDTYYDEDGVSLSKYVNVASETYPDGAPLEEYYDESNPMPITEEISYQSADPSIVKIEAYGDDYIAIPVKAGSTTITVTCGSYKVKLPVIVSSDDDEEW